MPRPTRRMMASAVAVCATAALAAWLYPSAGSGGMVYAAPGGEPLTLHLDYPPNRGPRCPVILFAPHRGDWGPSARNDSRCRTLIEGLNRRGYAVATAQYRQAGVHHFPAQIADGKRAVRWLRANADRLGLAGERIGAVGVSAGGYGVCMLGTAEARGGCDEPGENAVSARVHAVAALGAPTDLASRTWPRTTEQIYIRPYLGMAYYDDPELYARASPLTRVTSDAPPFLLFHSTDDRLVPVDQARTFADKLRRAGVSVELIEEGGAEHVWGGERLVRTVDRLGVFFDQHLRP
ncbi:alpha/beta hydrolase [Fimbriiglobus ruber]|uniref:Putative lipase/esterase n=1 Tax=Fimbriiglobus ruber TaxID=1908690 RepID=A0A225DDU1_9BACT|nr:alpha/beta hydrolase [Fimbriiglobus ruber]OWK39720.1 putative lipase/esterase [Fimbriiglobus ruber]